MGTHRGRCQGDALRNMPMHVPRDVPGDAPRDVPWGLATGRATERAREHVPGCNVECIDLDAPCRKLCCAAPC
eukprot:7558811-Pyramimonas_sp.AAC.1